MMWGKKEPFPDKSPEEKVAMPRSSNLKLKQLIVFRGAARNLCWDTKAKLLHILWHIVFVKRGFSEITGESRTYIWLI